MVLAAVDVNRNNDVDDVSTSKRRFSGQVGDTEADNDNTRLSIVVSSSEDDGDSDDNVGKSRPPRPPAKKAARVSKITQQQQRRLRRRSSARFLRLTGRFEEEEEEDEEDVRGAEQEQLGEMYKRAIRMNAENRINAGNSWGLRLIENIDKFLVDEDDDAHVAPHTIVPSTSNFSSSIMEETKSKEKRVNFTKASCTLDASVKIYSYRVDDVHLSSYRVLANLNRTDNGKKNGPSMDENEATDETTKEMPKRKETNSSERRTLTETLESNLANINMNKLDSAYDIDPLFHKMSKTFDEGGAKGLLLANLGVGSNGCNIIFDSKDDSATNIEDFSAEEYSDEPGNTVNREEGIIDISSLTSKLQSMLGGASIESIQLVPQLRSLRDDFAQLEADGFVDHNMPKKSRRYATSIDEEKEAEMSIHQEALERSRVSHATFAQDLPNQDESFAADDFGGDDDDDDDAEFAFADFVAADENGARYSSISFQNEAFSDDVPPGTTGSRSSTAALLDALCSGEALNGNGYEYFRASALEDIVSGNGWAGSAHWNVSGKNMKKKPASSRPETKSRRKKGAKERIFVDLSAAPALEDVLRPPPRSNRGTDPLQLSKAAKTKYGKTDNLLPPDACIGIEQLSTLFLRPNAVLRTSTNSGGSGKTVGFHNAIESFGLGFDDGANDYGDDDDGPGFEFADGVHDDDDFKIHQLEGVRKVDKIQVGYATIAKKVDVKRLKKDLWDELETTFAASSAEKELATNEGDAVSSDESRPTEPFEEAKPLSFQETVRCMESSKSQVDVTLPFYFICLLHLANEKGLRLDSMGLEDFIISQDDGAAPSFGTLPSDSTTGESATSIAAQRERRANEVAAYNEMGSDDESDDDNDP